MATAAQSRQRALSQQGRNLFNLVPAGGGGGLSTQQQQHNSFMALEETSEDDMVASLPPNSPRGNKVVALSPRLLWGRLEDSGTGAPWQIPEPNVRRGIPRLNLDPPPAAPATAAPKQQPAADTGQQDFDDDDDDDDYNNYTYAEFDVKNTRTYGKASKANTHKAAEQRNFNIAKRDAQRAKTKAAAAP
jgi:hypothetical protein